MCKEWRIPPNNGIKCIHREKRRGPGPRDGFGNELEKREDCHNDERHAVDVRYRGTVTPCLDIVATSSVTHTPRCYPSSEANDVETESMWGYRFEHYWVQARHNEVTTTMLRSVGLHGAVRTGHACQLVSSRHQQAAAHNPENSWGPSN